MAQLGVRVIQNSPEQHSRAAERAIRTIKDLARTTYLSLSYTLPPALYRNLVTFVTERYNILPQMVIIEVLGNVSLANVQSMIKTSKRHLVK